MLTNDERRFDDPAGLFVAARVADDALVNHVGLADDYRISLTLRRMHLEFDPLPAVSFELPYLERVQRRRSCARIDLGLDAIKTQLREADPLTPPQSQQFGFLSIFGHQRIVYRIVLFATKYF